MKECAANYSPQKKSRKHERERVGGTANRDTQQPCPGNLVGEGGTTDNCKQKEQKAECGWLRRASLGIYLLGQRLIRRSGALVIRQPNSDQPGERINRGRATNRA